jgi:hypothetical protein
VLVLTLETVRPMRAVAEKRPAAHGRTPLAVRWGLAAPSPLDFRPERMVLALATNSTTESGNLHAHNTGSSRLLAGRYSTVAPNHPSTDSHRFDEPLTRHFVALAVGLAPSGERSRERSDDWFPRLTGEERRR